jgi:ribosomal protein S18 acetylase RimI-like enzyme
MNPTITETAPAINESLAISALVTAFAGDPAVRWMYPDAEQYLTHFPEFIRALGGKAFEHHTAECLDGHSCAALWLPPEVQPDEAAIFGVLQRSVSAPLQAQVFSVLEQMGSFHPAEPHWYLPLIGVDPAEQGRGCGTALLRRSLMRCDRDGVPAYLESTNPRNISLYERFGFKAVGEIKTRTSPSIIPMVRLVSS